MTSLSQKIEWLFKSRRRPDGKEWKYLEVEEGTKKLGYGVSAPYLWNLRNGKAKNPGWLVLRGLSEFFGISIMYFYEENLDEETQQKYLLEAAMRDVGVGEITLRASKMTLNQREGILSMMRAFEKEE